MPLLRLRPPRHAGPVPRVLESVTTLLGPGEIRMCDAAGRKRRSRGASRTAGLPGGVPPPPRPEGSVGPHAIGGDGGRRRISYGTGSLPVGGGSPPCRAVLRPRRKSASDLLHSARRSLALFHFV